MTAGRRDTLVTLQRYDSVQDSYGEEVQAWADLGTEWAEVNWGRGDERRRAAMEQGAQPATFTVYRNAMTSSLTIRDRIMLDGQVWDIESIVPGKRLGEIDVTAVRAG